MQGMPVQVLSGIFDSHKKSHFFKKKSLVPIHVGHIGNLQSLYVRLNSEFSCFPRLLAICIASLEFFFFFCSLILYLSEKSRVQLVKVSVVRGTQLPKLVMHQTVMAGNCLKKFILL